MFRDLLMNRRESLGKSISDIDPQISFLNKLYHDYLLTISAVRCKQTTTAKLFFNDYFGG